ncbi:hypothetical protein EON65_43960, partial [archaeon]
MSFIYNNLIACLVLVVGSFLMLPINLLLPARFILKKSFFPVISSDWQRDIKRYNGSLPGDYVSHPMNLSVGPLGFPLVLQAPSIPTSYDAALELERWFKANEHWVSEAVHEYGGVLVRGLPISTPQEFRDDPSFR